MKALKRKNVTESNRNQITLKDDVFENLLVAAFVISSALIIVMLLSRALY
jgi:DNA recombination-dependent growth factor C